MNKWKQIGILLLAAACILSNTPATIVSATSIEEQQSEIEKQRQENAAQKSETESKKSEAEEEVDELQDEADALGKNYSSLSSKLASVEDSIAETKATITSTNDDILALEQELVEAETRRDEQYEGMKQRIQYIYENGTTDSLFLSLFTSDSLADLLRRAEYTISIVSYDRQMVEAYEELTETIASKSETLKEKQEELESLQLSLSDQMDTLDDLVDEAGDAYSAKKSEVAAAQYTVSEYNALIARYDAEEASLEAQQAALMAQAAQQYTEAATSESEEGTDDSSGSTTVTEDTSGSISYSESDLRILTCIIYGEARGESYAGQLAVGSVIMNRVKSQLSPFNRQNTIYDVVYASGQFEPVSRGYMPTYYDLYDNGDASYGANYTAMQSCKQAAIQVLNGYRSGDWLFFMTEYYANYFGITGYTMIGNHAFFRVWGAN